MRLSDGNSFAELSSGIGHVSIRTVCYLRPEHVRHVSGSTLNCLFRGNAGKTIVRRSQFNAHRMGKIKRDADQPERNPKDNGESGSILAFAATRARTSHAG